MTALGIKQSLIKECSDNISYYEKELEKAREKKQHILVIEAFRKVIYEENTKRDLIEKHFIL